MVEVLFLHRRPPEMFAQFGGADDVSGGVLHESDVLQGAIDYFSIVVADRQRPVPNFLTDTYG